jgi:hypothetical protein
MDATTTYRREILEFIAGIAETTSTDDSQSESLRWLCGCTASGRDNAYRIAPCDEHLPEFEDAQDMQPP